MVGYRSMDSSLGASRVFRGHGVMDALAKQAVGISHPELSKEYVISRHVRGVDCEDCPVWELQIDVPNLSDAKSLHEQQALLNRVAEALEADWICLTIQGQLYWRWPRAWEEKLHRWQASQQEQIRWEQQLGRRLEQFRARWQQQ